MHHRYPPHKSLSSGYVLRDKTALSAGQKFTQWITSSTLRTTGTWTYLASSQSFVKVKCSMLENVFADCCSSSSSLMIFLDFSNSSDAADKSLVKLFKTKKGNITGRYSPKHDHLLTQKDDFLEYWRFHKSIFSFHFTFLFLFVCVVVFLFSSNVVDSS